MDFEKVEDHLGCVICMEVRMDINESDCCHQLFCSECYKTLSKGPCPMCKNQPFTVKPSQPIRRMVSMIKKDCPFKCEMKIPLQEMENHKLICENREFECVEYNCYLKGNRKIFLNHILEQHEKKMIEIFDRDLSQKTMSVN